MENLELRDGLAILTLTDKSRVSFDATDIPDLAAMLDHLKPKPKRKTKKELDAEAKANGDAVAKALVSKNASTPVRQHVLTAREVL